MVLLRRKWVICLYLAACIPKRHHLPTRGDIATFPTKLAEASTTLAGAIVIYCLLSLLRFKEGLKGTLSKNADGILKRLILLRSVLLEHVLVLVLKCRLKILLLETQVLLLLLLLRISSSMVKVQPSDH